MAETSNDLTTRVQRIEVRGEGIAQSLSDLSRSTRDAFVEQRQYVEFAFGRLEQAMHDRFDAVDARFTRQERN
jgi:hypothetical protein